MQFNIYIFTQTLYHHFVAFQVEDVKGEWTLRELHNLLITAIKVFLLGSQKQLQKHKTDKL